MKVCLRYRKNEADAAAMLNQAFLKILNQLDRLPSEEALEAWSKRITINTLIDDFRKHRKVKELIADTDVQSLPEGLSGVDYNEAEQQFDADQLQAFIRQLPPVSAKVFNLFAVDGFPHADIADMLGISEGTSRWHLASARKKLQEMILRSMHSPKIAK
jgi:RNA polymerase sigma-70 factor (ECF subfamily)